MQRATVEAIRISGDPSRRCRAFSSLNMHGACHDAVRASPRGELLIAMIGRAPPDPDAVLHGAGRSAK